MESPLSAPVSYTHTQTHTTTWTYFNLYTEGVKASVFMPEQLKVSFVALQQDLLKTLLNEIIIFIHMSCLPMWFIIDIFKS